MNKDVIDVQHVGGTRLLLMFEQGDAREIDIAAHFPFEGIFAPLKDPAYFQKVRVNSDVGTIVWPNGADFCPDVLYEKSEPVSAARRATLTKRTG